VAPLAVALALRRCGDRRALGMALWPECAPDRATGNLRSALWRLRLAAPGLVADGPVLRLSPDVLVDVDEIVRAADDIAAGAVDGQACVRLARRLLHSTDFLPGWDTPEVVIERAWLHEHVVHGMERAAARLLAAGEPAHAAAVAAALVSAEPLRESAVHRLLEALLAEGNVALAHRALDGHRKYLARTLGIDVDPRLSAVLLTAAR